MALLPEARSPVDASIWGGQTMSETDSISLFLNGSSFAVVGASLDRAKYGNKVLRAYLQAGRDLVPIHPREPVIEGLLAYPNLSSAPGTFDGISVVTPPVAAESIVEEAARLGIQHVWFQPGAESPAAVARGRALGMNVIAGGPCILVTLRYHES